VAHADPAADYPAALVGLGATVITDRRSIAADDYFTGLFATALARDELVKAVQFPIPKRAAYAKFAHRASKYALVGVFVVEHAAGIRVAVTGAGPKVFRLASYEATKRRSARSSRRARSTESPWRRPASTATPRRAPNTVHT
jgi:aerobic carbon-monoxide dehydrogenase medium subunit